MLIISILVLKKIMKHVYVVCHLLPREGGDGGVHPVLRVQEVHRVIARLQPLEKTSVVLRQLPSLRVCSVIDDARGARGGW